MPRFVIFGAVILSLALFYPCSASQVIPQKQAGKKNIPAKTVQGVSPSPAVQRQVVNIFVDKIDGGAIYSRDGRKFEITGSTRVIDNSHHVTKMREAELSFVKGSLVAVILK